MLRIGVVGVGAWGRNIARVLSELPTSDLAFVCDLNLRVAKQIGELYRTRWFTDLVEALEKVEVDAVAVATPTPTHHEVCMKILEYSKHVFVEKPLADSSANARAMIEEAARRGVKLMVGHIERFNPVIEALKATLERGKLGNPLYILARRIGRPTKASPVGVVKDLAVHDIDLMRHLLIEDPKLVFAMCQRMKHKECEDLANVILAFRECLGYLETDWLSSPKVRKLLLAGERAFAFADLLNKSLLLQIGTSRLSVPIKPEEPLKLELAHFVECILHDKQPLVTGRDGLKALEIAEAALESAKSGQLVAL